MERIAQAARKSRETDITVTVSLDGGSVEIETGIGFFDHMLTALAVHGGFGLKVHTEGDLYVDCHHTIEDTGIVLGQAFAKALGDKGGICRFGSFFVPMDEALASSILDVSGRPFFVFSAPLKNERVGTFDTCMTEEFFRAVCINAEITLHLQVAYGANDHHMIEAAFKAFAHSLQMAVTPLEKGTILSSKGVF